jgi:N-carbamoyl-L-amino-acid hydrolase
MMNRGDFIQTLLTGTAGWSVGMGRWHFDFFDQISVNGKRLNLHLKELSAFGKNPQGGVTRSAYSQADIKGRAYVRSLMEKAGLTVSTDATGNILGRRAGKEPGLPVLMTGSHIDSVPEGGNYDGPVGVMGAIEAAQTLQENDMILRHPLEVIVFANEEGGKTGSRALFDDLTEEDLNLKTHSGKTNREGIKAIGGNPEELEKAVRDKEEIAAFVELHVEQGGVLEKEGKTIGVVEGIVGIKRWIVTVKGFANHAGTTPMNDRRDALLGAARFVEAVNNIITSEQGQQVGTVGQIEAAPGAPNVIPGEVTLSLEIRDLRMDKIDALFAQIRSRAKKVGQEDNLNFSFNHVYTTTSALTNDQIKKIVATSADEFKYSYMSLPSGAGHDAQSIAQIAPIGMIFIPSVGGISHSPEEYSRPEDIEAGTNVLLHILFKMDQM